MELDVHLSRSGDEPWGFRLIGGSDYGMPLTVVQVHPNSPAFSGGLQNGDTVLRIQDEEAQDMTHEDARVAMAKASTKLLVGVARGLYDPVLDDYEPIYEPIDQEDFDQPSHPTEVQFQIQNFIGDPNVDIKLPEFQDSTSLPISRSLTASPFVPSSKPYRPFSTEPIPPNDVPPLEDPIILNPNFTDNFCKHEGDDEFLPKTRFKLPISEQYDPDGTRKKRGESKAEDEKLDAQEICIPGFKSVCLDKKETFVEEVKKEIQSQQFKESNIEEISGANKMYKSEVKYSEHINKDINFESLESTAVTVVEESINKAVTVAQEIKNEIDVELRSSMEKTDVSNLDVSKYSEIESLEFKTKSIQEKTTEAVATEIKSDKVESKKSTAIAAAKEFIDLIDKTTEEIVKQNGHTKSVDVSKQVEIFEKIKENEKVTDKHKSSKIVDASSRVGSVDSKHKSQIMESQSSSTSKTQNIQQRKLSSATETKESKAKMSTSRLLAEQRAYTIGLQTIPHIRGNIHSSYHYNLLLKTFFIHLTDVMVALSRFILMEPVLSQDDKQNEVVETKLSKTSETVATESAQSSETSMAEMKSKFVENQIEAVKASEEILSKNVEQSVFDVKDELVQEAVTATSILEKRLDKEVGEITEKRKLSGSKMAQLTERKSAELTGRMDAVISEFQTKAGIEEISADSKGELLVENRVAETESVHSKVDKEISEKISSETKSLVASEMSQTLMKSKQEIKESKRKEREGGQTYVAIVESHVYTNQDTVLEDHQFSGLTSETASVQSPNETHTAIDISEAFDAAKIVESSKINQEVVKVEDKKEKNTAITEISSSQNESKIQKMQQTILSNQVETKQRKLSEAIEVIDKSVTQLETTEEPKKIPHFENINVECENLIESNVKDEEVRQTIEVVETNPNDFLKANVQIMSQHQAYQESEKFVSSVAGFSENLESFKIEDKSEKFETNKRAVAQIQSKTDKVEVKHEETKISEQIAATEKSTETKEMSKEVYISQYPELAEESKSVKTTALAKTDMQSSKKITESAQAETKSTEQVVTSDIKFQSKEINEKAKVQDESLIVFKEKITEVCQDVEIKDESEVHLKKHIEVQRPSEIYEANVTRLEQRTYDSLESKTQESSFTATVVETNHVDARQLTLDLNKDYPVEKQSSTSSIPSEISTPTPSHVPPTPLTDEYIFKLEIPLPRSRGGTPYPREPTPEPEPVIEDPNIVKKRLVPHIDLTIESKIFDPPLPTPPEDKVSSPVYTKPGLRGGAVKIRCKKEEIREIERKSSLLASAIDETIRNIEQYKQQVANENQSITSSETATTESDATAMFNGFSKEVTTKVFKNGEIEPNTKFEESENKVREANVSSNVVIDVTSNKDLEEDISAVQEAVQEIKEDPMAGYRPVEFNPDDIVHKVNVVPPVTPPPPKEHHAFKTESGEVIGSKQGIVDGLEEPIVDLEVAKELGKPGMTENKIAELISGESEMLREAHVMGLSRVIKSHMHRANDDDSSVDFNKIKPILESLKDSEVLRALNEELVKTKEEKKKEERKWTTFMQKPSRPVPRAKFGYPGWTAKEELVQDSYKVKIVKQPKPKVAPDYKPEDFETGPLPWEERALNEPPAPPVEPEDPILIPEETPEFLEAVDPLPESEVPDLEDTGIPLPPPPQEEFDDTTVEEPNQEEDVVAEGNQKSDTEAVVEETEQIVEEMEQNRIMDQLLNNVQNMVDPNAPLDQQLKQMQVQIAALAQLPCVIQQTLELVTKQLNQMTTMESTQRIETHAETEVLHENTMNEVNEESEEVTVQNQNDVAVEDQSEIQNVSIVENGESAQEEKPTVTKPSLTQEEMARLKMEEQEMLDEQQRIEKQKKELMDQMKVELNGRQIKQRPTPRVGKPAPMFGPLTPQERPVVLPGGRRWRKPEDAYNEQFIAETLSAQAEIIQGKAKGLPFESARLPYDQSINFKKYEKPPVSLDHLQNSDTYKLIHNMEQMPTRRVDMLTPVMAEADYREKCRSMTPSSMEQRINIP